MSGWILIHRRIQDNWLWQKRPFTEGQAWIDMLLMVNHKQESVLIKGAYYECGRGESMRSLDSWAERWGWHRSKVRRFFDKLEKHGTIVRIKPTCTATRKETPKTTHLKIVNYDTYQKPRHVNDTKCGTETGTKQTKTKISGKNSKEPNLEENPCSQKLDLELQKKLLTESQTYSSMLERYFSPYTPKEQKTFNDIFNHLLKIARNGRPNVFSDARRWLADKVDYIKRHDKTILDAKRMFVAEIKKQTSYAGKNSQKNAFHS